MVDFSVVNLSSILFIVYSLYLIVTAVFLILDNREPSTTLAWLFVFILLPIVGLVIYFILGRNWRKMNHKRQLEYLRLERKLYELLSPLIKRQGQEIKFVEEMRNINYKRKLLHLIHRNSNSILTMKNSVRVLESGKEKFDSLKRDLRNAKKYIHMEYFIWRSDNLTREIRDILVEKAREGVEIRILYDAMGGLFLPWRYIRSLRKAGVKIYPFFNFLRPFKFHTINYRNHRKIVVIDGKVGYTGGMNMAEEYITGGNRFKSWKDTHLFLEGEVVSMLNGIFIINWYMTTKENLFKREYFIGEKVKGKNLPIQITTSGPDSEWASIKQLYFSLISSADKSIYIQTPYFIPDPSVQMALQTAALSGLDVRIMIAGVPDKWLPYWSAFTYFKDLIKSGVRIYHYNKGFMHSKVVMVDNEICSVGSANMDVRSFHLNYELNSVIYDKKITGRLEKNFLKDLRYCDEFTYSDYKKLGILRKLRNSLARLVTPLL